MPIRNRLADASEHRSDINPRAAYFFDEGVALFEIAGSSVLIAEPLQIPVYLAR
jgi:hypothetical protein